MPDKDLFLHWLPPFLTASYGDYPEIIIFQA